MRKKKFTNADNKTKDKDISLNPNELPSKYTAYGPARNMKTLFDKDNPITKVIMDNPIIFAFERLILLNNMVKRKITADLCTEKAIR